MSLNLVSPGVKVREVDLTVGRLDAVNDQVGAFVAPFAKGPVNTPVLIETEQDLLNTFGKPLSKDSQYEYWYTASSYLSYGGTLRVVRSSGSNLKNANYPVSSPVTLVVENEEDYKNNHQSDTDWIWAARTPGEWGNDLKVCVIDGRADQRVSIGTFGIQAGYALTVGLNTTYADATGNVTSFNGYLKAIVTDVNVDSVDVKVVSAHSNSGTESVVDYKATGYTFVPSGAGNYIQVFNNVGTASSLEKERFRNNATVGLGSTTIVIDGTPAAAAVGDLIQTENGVYKARIVNINGSNITVDNASPVSYSSTSFVVTYTRSVGDGTNNKGEGLLTRFDNTSEDWYNLQKLDITSSEIYWKTIAPKPSTSQYASERGGKNDELHVVVVDDSGKVSGVAGNLLEKYTGLSKASDGRISPSQNNYYKTLLTNASQYVFAGTSDAVNGLNFTSLGGYTQTSGATIAWGQDAASVNFGSVGNKTYTLSAGADYAASGGMEPTLGEILSGYENFRNPAEYSINFILNGPSGGTAVYDSQAKANRLIDIVNARKDCIACISPHRDGVVNVSNSDTQTTNVVGFFDALASSSYAVFDSGYKYMFDRFNNEFRYIPLNGDIAGLMARTSINSYSWFSPAGSSRGAINNAVKLAYNPSQAQRDLLYPARVNPVIFSPGAGIILFGDKTAQSTASAFDRINVRRLFLTLEETVSRAANSQLFEFNDVITRANFVNIIEPFLRDVKAKRGIADFLIVCDESNNTPDVVDANQFRADIFVKPARSINFIGLTFVANRTGVSFEEVVGSV